VDKARLAAAADRADLVVVRTTTLVDPAAPVAAGADRAADPVGPVAPAAVRIEAVPTTMVPTAARRPGPSAPLQSNAMLGLWCMR
jgi:hypothetical protein